MSATGTSGGRWNIGIDIGGTCTDCVVIDEAGTVTLGKAFSTPDDLSRGILDAVGVAAAALGTDVGDLLGGCSLFLHSTTVAENAIVDDALVPVGLLTTRGHAGTLFATRGAYGRWSGITDDEMRNPTETSKPRPLVPPDRIVAVRERTDRAGRVVAPADEAEVEEALTRLLAAGAESIAVCFLWSFNNPQNELLVRKVLQRMRPDVFISLSHEVAPVLGEYERTSTVVLNAALGPIVRSYLAALRGRLAAAGFVGTLLVMQAHGGLASEETAGDRPVGMIESGPVSGLMGCKRMGELLGHLDVISADMGGTTFKVGPVRAGAVEYQRESLALRYHYSLPKIDVVSLGLAGGSVIGVDPVTGVPSIGPRSAGSYPGPVVYAHGGTEPTLTDVDAVLGYLDEGHFLGGTVPLAVDAAVAALARVGGAMGLDALGAATAMYRLANSYIHDFLHRMTVQRGLDPRRFALFSTGGTAGMHLPVVARSLGIPVVVVPYTAAVQGAFGLVSSDVAHEEVMSRPLAMPADPEVVARQFAELEERVGAALLADGFASADTELLRSIDLRYARQVHEVTTPLPPASALTVDVLAATVGRFEALYRERYGPDSTFAEAGVELVSYRVRGVGRLRQPDLRQFATGPTATVAPVRRLAVVPSTGELTEVDGHELEALPVGAELRGPALVWSPITTVVLDAGQRAVVDGYRNLVITEAP